MAENRKGAVLRQIRAVFTAGNIASLTDGQLLERFAAYEGEAAELAFAALVERHGPMVLHVCRGILRNQHDAQDAFQATFLVLVRKARSLWVRDSLGPWLHDVAYRVAAHARSASARRRRHERRAAEMAARTSDTAIPDDFGLALHEEIHRLPERYRAPIVLCDLGRVSHEQAALQLGLPIGTIKSRLARGRGRLRSRLIRRGLAPSAAVLGTAPTAEATSMAVPSGMVDSAVRTARRFVAGKTAGGAVSAPVAALAEGVIKTMILSRLSIVALCLTSASFVVVGTGMLVGQEPGAEPGSSRIQSKSVQEAARPEGKDSAAPPSHGHPKDDLTRRLVEIARRRLETQKAFYEEGRITIDRYLDASAQLMDAERQASETREGRIAAVRAHLDRARQVEEREREGLQGGRGTEVDVTEAEARRIQAELELKAASDPANHEIAGMDRRLREVERKLEQILQILGKTKLERGTSGARPPARK